MKKPNIKVGHRYLYRWCDIELYIIKVTRIPESYYIVHGEIVHKVYGYRDCGEQLPFAIEYLSEVTPIEEVLYG